MQWYATQTQQQPFAATRDSLASLALLVAVAGVAKVYLMFVVMAHARMVLTAAAAAAGGVGSGSRPVLFSDEDGWKGKLGRVMVAVGREYWVAVRDEDDDYDVEEWKVGGGGGGGAGAARVPLAWAVDAADEEEDQFV